MSELITPAQLQAAAAMVELLNQFGGGVVIGGLAVGLLANPRYTKDVDGMVVADSSAVDALLRAASEHGFSPRFADMAEFARRSHLLVLKYDPTGTTVDILLGATPFEEQTLQRAATYEYEGASFPLPSPEDLIILKGIAHRDQDMADIRAIAEVYPDLDRGRVEYWLRQFAELLDSPDIWDDVERLLKRTR